MHELYPDFVKKLSLLYGSFEPEHKRFTKCSNSEISRELGYSDAQFSRLINDTATEGEYQRAIQNVERILENIHLSKKVKRLEEGNPSSGLRKYLPYFFTFIVILALGSIYFLMPKNGANETGDSRDDMLKWAFETSFINSYHKLDELPADCDFPCYKLQGKWVLDHSYKIPFFRERNGFHYLATEVKLYARCFTEESKNGDILEGYEYQKHEIWYDRRELPIDSFVMESGQSNYNQTYQDLDFSKDENFVKIATVHTFFRNEFTIDSLGIHRKGKVIGRDLEITAQENLEKFFSSEEEIKNIRTEMNRIATNRLKDFSRPIKCEISPFPGKDLHSIQDGAIMSYNCQLTTARVPMDYTKTYRLENQYIKNNCGGAPTN